MATSCTDSDKDDFAFTQNTDRIIKARDPKYPWEPIPKGYIPSRSTKLSRSTLNHSDYIGRSYKTDYFPFEDSRNLGYEVIDIKALEKDYPSYFNAWGTKNSAQSHFSYTSFDEYVSKSRFSQTIS